MANNIGKITQIIGAVLDIKFTEGNLPEINDAIRIPLRGDQAGKELTVEVSQHLGDDTVRCIAMGSTDGLVRGMDAVAAGGPISVPVGENTLGRMFNVEIRSTRSILRPAWKNGRSTDLLLHLRNRQHPRRC